MDLRRGRIQGTSPDWADDLRDVAEYIGQEEVNLLQKSEFSLPLLIRYW